MDHSVAFIYAHPDDESFLSAGLIRELADEHVNPVLLLATKGDAGNKNGYVSHLSHDQLASVREKEMEHAAEILGISVIEHLGFPDGKLTQVDENLFVGAIVNFINKYQPKVIFTFPEDGCNFHPDHMTISKMTTTAVLSGKCPTVQKLYYCMSNTLAADGHHPTITIDVEKHWPMKVRALQAHESQILAIKRFFGDLQSFPENRRYESFVLKWNKGLLWTSIEEKTIFDDLTR
ncbi:PIG-L deacetylase family protein [Paenibacillus beijingensis]|uniref:GlcNAc-PI de-N-acetylase n=1 Tax=Paenibacillus beijingensis TaxID=1126833 RepID=A0A0D5NPZ9_9BACL|nr:PIG-L deacetylase family protein [Paenibacillus beijingensis]AJY77077.1 GlcNAc-PI de-N-acetylase [Paenibacillus beijingensis]